jgi:hypothetical protein
MEPWQKQVLFSKGLAKEIFDFLPTRDVALTLERLGMSFTRYLRTTHLQAYIDIRLEGGQFDDFQKV